MNKFVPHKIDSEGSFESDLLGDVKAGFPSPAEDIREKLDLIKLLVKHKASTFFFRVSTVKRVEMGDNMVRLMPANELNTVYKPIVVTPDNEFLIWGVVTYVIKKM